jgi:enoyl-CoA hydratase/carnithine racemase
MSELVTITKSDGVADVINRPDKYNALSPEMFKPSSRPASRCTMRATFASSCCRATGGASALASIFELQGMAGSSERQPRTNTAALFERSAEHPENRAQRPAMVWKRLPMPVIAAIHGVAYGGGCRLRLPPTSDCAPDAKLSVMRSRD